MADRLIEASDGRQALAILADHPVDLMLTDYRMPGLDGSALLARLPASLRKDELTAERLEFTIRAALRGAGRGAR
jgi:CheY-like chemotaxis protein